MITTGITHTFGLDHHKSDELTGSRILARGWAYPNKEWFSLSIGKNQEEHITWDEWKDIVANVEELKKMSATKYGPIPL